MDIFLTTFTYRESDYEELTCEATQDVNLPTALIEVA